MGKKYKHAIGEIKNWEPIRDPIYNYIYYNEELEKKIIDTEYVQRLRRVYQLPSARFVYPSASHSRFLHSLGVMHLAGEFAEKLLNREDRISPDEKKCLKQAARLAGLLHDVGHGPFSHLFDEVVISESKKLRMKGINSHEDISRLIIEKSEINKILSKWGLDKLVKDLFWGGEELEYPIRSLSRIFRGWLFTADVLDFLPRDAYFCGIKEWGIDVERIVHWTKIHKDTLASEKRVKPSIYGYLLNRFQMFENVYFHRTARAIDCMMREIFRRVSRPLKLENRVEKCLNGDFSGFLELDDYSIFNLILKSKSRTKSMREAQKLAKSILTRDIQIRVLDEFAPPYRSEAGVLDDFERKFTERDKLLLGELLDKVKKQFISRLKSMRVPIKNICIYPDFTSVRYFSDHPLTWFGDLPIWDHRTDKVVPEPVLKEFLDNHAFPLKRIRVYADKRFEEKYGKRIRGKQILREVVAGLAETRRPVF